MGIIERKTNLHMLEKLLNLEAKFDEVAALLKEAKETTEGGDSQL